MPFPVLEATHDHYMTEILTQRFARQTESRVCTEEKYNYVLQSVSKGALSVNFSSIAIELNIPRDDFSLITIELTFVILGHGFKKAGSVLYDICAPVTRTF